MCLNSSEFRVRSLELLRRTLLWQQKRHSRESGNPDAVPAKAGNYTKELDSCFHRKPWIPCQARNDKIGLHEFLFIALFFVIFFTAAAHAEPLKISLLLGDNHSKTAIEAVKEIEKAYPGVKGKVKFQVLTSKAIRDRETDIKEIAASKTVFILLIMDRQAVEKVKPHISEVIKNGGRVYAVGGTYTKEHKDMGLIDDVVVKKYYKENGLENIKT